MGKTGQSWRYEEYCPKCSRQMFEVQVNPDGTGHHRMQCKCGHERSLEAAPMNADEARRVQATVEEAVEDSAQTA